MQAVSHRHLTHVWTSGPNPMEMVQQLHDHVNDRISTLSVDNYVNLARGSSRNVAVTGLETENKVQNLAISIRPTVYFPMMHSLEMAPPFVSNQVALAREDELYRCL